jgi:hypothetical protein
MHVNYMSLPWEAGEKSDLVDFVTLAALFIEGCGRMGSCPASDPGGSCSNQGPETDRPH